MYSIITLCLAFLLTLFSISVLSKIKEKNFDIYLKALTVLFFVIGIARMHFSDSFVETALSGSDIPESLFRWAYNLSYPVIPMAVFLKTRLTRNIALYFSLPVGIIGALRFDSTMYYFLSEGGRGLPTAAWFRYVFYITELVLAISIPIIMKYKTKHRFNKSDKKEWQNLSALPFMLLYAMPAYIPQSLFGYMKEIPDGRFSPWHIGWLVLMAVIFFGIYFAFRKKNSEDKWALLTFLALTQFYLSNSVFLRGFRFSRIPLQFCCVACAFYLAIIFTKSERLFNFSSMCNVSGAIVACILTTFSDGPLKFWNVHYIYEHTMVLCFPIVALALGVFPRPTKRAIKDLFIVYSCYFAFCLILGTVINVLSTDSVYDVNYFYMFDCEEALSYLPFATFLGAIEIPLGEIMLYPILIVTVYAALFALSLGVMGIIRLGFKISDAISHKQPNGEAVREPQTV